MSNSHGDDYLSLFEDDHVNLSPEHNEWKILIVDDDENVHQATVLALTNTQLLGRNILLPARVLGQAGDRMPERQRRCGGGTRRFRHAA